MKTENQKISCIVDDIKKLTTRELFDLINMILDSTNGDFEIIIKRILKNRERDKVLMDKAYKAMNSLTPADFQKVLKQLYE